MKFSSLRTINLSRGVGNDAFVLSLGGAPATYHSEKHFSLGELCILKLLRLLKDAGNNSMIIIDELEMALHPRAQVNLLKHLERISKDKSLTIIFSTHSATLLKTINKKNIIYLDRQESGDVVPVVGCFPTYAIGSIAADEESLPDIVLYVEDTFAREVLQAFYEKFAEEKFKDPTTRPTIKIVPIGPFDAVIAFLDRNHSVLPSQVLQRAVLDYDVKDESIKTLQKSKSYAKLAQMEKNSKDISYLPFTPEVGLADYIVDNTTAFESSIRARCGDNQIRISPLTSDYDCTVSGADRRKSAKAFVEKLEKYLSNRLQKESDSVVEHICGVFANIGWPTYRRDFMELFGSVCR
ncbi:AAA family ATPase [Asaia sp. As-1742]|uniref:AAA family ATPase n=1 Tax=Asaia sp. As-1742 TaxID=2608325 RepID=UPI001F04A14A|nr:AAA family ATPase [Asaia sp. As-1742]